MHPVTTFATIILLTTGFAFGQEGKFERTLSVAGALDLDVQTDSGGIVVTAGAAGTIQVRGILKAQTGWLSGSTGGTATLASMAIRQNGKIYITQGQGATRT